jgi:hypothetical protein
MTRKNKIMVVVVGLVLFVFHHPGWPQYFPDPDTAGKIRVATQYVTLVGKIGFDKRLGGYYLKNNPRYKFGDKRILNQNYEVLEKWRGRGKTVTIQGKVDPKNWMATHLFIERLNGEPYQGIHPPLVIPR